MPDARKAQPQERDDEWVSLPTASRELGEHRETVLARAVDGELRAKKIAGRICITRESLDRAKAAKEAREARVA